MCYYATSFEFYHEENMPITRERFEEILSTGADFKSSILTVDSRYPKDLAAFLILHRLLPGTDDILSAAEHDIIYLSIDIDELCKVATEQDVVDLRNCHVMIQDDSLAMFV